MLGLLYNLLLLLLEIGKVRDRCVRCCLRRGWRDFPKVYLKVLGLVLVTFDQH